MTAVDRAYSIESLRAIAERRLPRMLFDFVDGGAEDEVSLGRNREAFGRIELRPRVLAGAGAPDLSVEVFGERLSLPVMISPTGSSGMLWPEGETVAAVIRILGAAVVGIALSLGASMSLARPVDLELILAVDASLSVSLDEYLMQVRGLAAALRSPEVIAAIERVGDAGIAVAVVQWSSANQQEMSLGWTHITDGASARAFARRIVPMPRMQLQGNTAIGALVEAALPMFRDNGFEGARRTIDISGDGRSNEGPHTNLARDHAVRERVTINGLAILNRDPWLDDYYRESVVSGPAAFVMAAKDYRDFGSAMMLKLTREIGGLPLARHGDPLAIARSDQ